MIILEYKSNGTVPDKILFGGLQRPDILSEKQIFTGKVLIEQTDQMEKCRFPFSGSACDDRELVLLKYTGEMIQDFAITK